MNLVAKEFVASRDDEAGVLVLSQFTGAARELPEALIVNPYDADQCATALDAALTMPLREQRARMRLMRGLVREFNVYRWAGRMLLDAANARGAAASRAGCPSSTRAPPTSPRRWRGRTPAVGGSAPESRRRSYAAAASMAVGLLPRRGRHAARARAHARRGACGVGHTGSRSRRARDHRRRARADHRTIDRRRRSALRRRAAADRRSARTGATRRRRCVDGGRERREGLEHRATSTERRRATPSTAC